MIIVFFSLIVDPVLIRRCKTTLIESGGHILDADDLADALRRKYPEYERRKRAAFKNLITDCFRALNVDEEMLEANRTGIFNKIRHCADVVPTIYFYSCFNLKIQLFFRFIQLSIFVLLLIGIFLSDLRDI